MYSVLPGHGVFIPILGSAVQVSSIFAVPLRVHRREEALTSLLNELKLSFVILFTISLL